MRNSRSRRQQQSRRLTCLTARIARQSATRVRQVLRRPLGRVSATSTLSRASISTITTSWAACSTLTD